MDRIHQLLSHVNCLHTPLSWTPVDAMPAMPAGHLRPLVLFFFFEVTWEVRIIPRSDKQDLVIVYLLFLMLLRTLTEVWWDLSPTPLPYPWHELGNRWASEEWMHSSPGHHSSAVGQIKRHFSVVQHTVKIIKSNYPRKNFGIRLSLYQCSAKYNA